VVESRPGFTLPDSITETVLEVPKYFELTTRSIFRGQLPLQPGELNYIRSVVPTNGFRGRLKIRLLHDCARLTGARALRQVETAGRRLTEADWAEITSALSSSNDAKFSPAKGDRVYTIQSLSQSETKVIGLLISRNNQTRCFVKVKPDGPTVEQFRLIPGLNSFAPQAISFPRLLSVENTDSFVLHFYSGLELENQRPIKLTAERLELVGSEIDNLLRPAEHPSNIPPHWKPRHCDLTAWNLKRARDGRIAVLDWDTAQFAPPATDIVRFFTTAPSEALDALLRRHFKPVDLEEAVYFLRGLHGWNGPKSRWSERRLARTRRLEEDLMKADNGSQ